MSEHSRQILRKIHEAEEAVKLSKENVNRILEIVSTLSSHLCVEDTKDSQSNFEISLRCIQALRMLFLKFFHEGDLDVSSHGRLSTTASEEEESTPQKVFRNWLGKQWVKFLNLLTKGILGEDSRISLYCFRTAMKIVVLELEHITRAKITSDSVDVETWNTTLAETLGDGYFHNVISAVFSSSNSDDSLMKELLNGWISEYADIKYWVLRVVKSILMDQSLEKTGSLENNIFEILLAYDIEVENSKFYSSMAVDPFKTTQTGKRKRDVSPSWNICSWFVC